MRNKSALLITGLAVFLSNVQPIQATTEVKVIRVLLAAQPQPSREFVEPDDEKRVSDAVKDLRSALNDDHTLRFVTQELEADAIVRVMGRTLRPMGSTATFVVPNGFGGFDAASYPTWRTFVFVRMTAGTYSKDLVGAGRSYVWRAAARDAASQIQRWIEANRETLVKNRRPGTPSSSHQPPATSH